MPRSGRRSIRLPDYDYRQPGWYFVTECTAGRECLFGDVVDGVVRLNAAGRIVNGRIRALPSHFARLALDAYVVMPDHLHLVLALDDPAGGGGGERNPGACWGEASARSGSVVSGGNTINDLAAGSGKWDASPLPPQPPLPPTSTLQSPPLPPA
jgi:hypothetical protein